MIHLGEFLSSRCPVWYTRRSSSDCSSHLKPMWSSKYASPLWWRSFKRTTIRKKEWYTSCNCAWEQLRRLLNRLISYSSAASWTVVCSSFPWTSFSRSTSPYANASLLNIHKASGSVPALSLVFPLVRCCRTSRPNSFAKLCNAFLCHSFPSMLVSSSTSSLRFTLTVRLSKPFRCLWTQLSLCVMALTTGIKYKRGLVEPLYWF